MEASEFRKQMEPLAPLAEIEGIGDMDPQEIGQLIQWAQMAQDPEQFETWWSTVGEEMGFFADDEDPEGGEEGDIPPAVQQQLQSLAETVQALQQQLSGQEKISLEQEAMQIVESQLKGLREEHGDFDEDAVCQLAMSYDDDPDAIKKGFADYQRLTGAAQSDFVEGKERQPAAAVSGGSPDTAAPRIDGFDQAAAVAKQRLAGAR